MMLTVLVVVAHLGCLRLRSVAGRLDRFFGDLRLLMVDGAGGRGVNGGAGDVNFLLVRGAEARGVDGVFVDDGASLVGGTVGGRVNRGTSYVDLLAVVGLDTGTVFALSGVDGRAVLAAGVDLNA